MSHETRKTPALQYINEFVALVCAPDLLEANLFRNAAEITESFGAWAALRKHAFPFVDSAIDLQASERTAKKRFADSLSPGEPGEIAAKCHEGFEDVIVCVGDGYRPQTGALCAFLAPKAWQVLSVDPMLEYDSYLDRICVSKTSATQASHIDSWKSISRLTMCRARIQDVCIRAKRVIFVLVHAHVSIDDCMKALDADTRVVAFLAVPCCDWSDKQESLWSEPACITYADLAMASEKNFVRVWRSGGGWGLKKLLDVAPFAAAQEACRGTEVVLQPASMKRLFGTALSKHFAADASALLLSTQFIVGRIAGVRRVGLAVFYDLVDLPAPAPGARIHSARLIAHTSECGSSHWDDYLQWYVHWVQLNTAAQRDRKLLPTAEDRKRYQDNRMQLLVNPDNRGVASAEWAYNLRSGDVLFVPVAPDLAGLMGSSSTLEEATVALSRARWIANPETLQLLFSPTIINVDGCGADTATATSTMATRRRVCR
jgi:hypothetical protein